MGKKVVVGIDIGGTNTRIGLADDEGNIMADCCISTSSYPKAEGYVAAIHEGIQSLLKGGGSNPYEMLGIGIGAPNGNYHTGCIECAVNLPWREIVPLAAMLNNYYPDMPIKLTNDANAAAIAEMVYGNAKGLSDFIEVTLGTGLGSGFVANGEMIYGHDGLAGELGHITAVQNGRSCNCGRVGCLETYASAPGIKRTVFELLAATPDKDYDGELRDFSYNNLTAKKIDELARKGDIIAKKAFEITGEILGRSLADMVAITSPSVIFLFGGLAEAREMIFDPTIKSMNENLLSFYRGKVKILPTGLGNQNTGILGAAALIWKESI